MRQVFNLTYLLPQSGVVVRQVFNLTYEAVEFVPTAGGEYGGYMLRLVLIFLAGGCGCVLRYTVAGWVQRLCGGSFPLGTLAVNVIGCVLLGFLAALFTGPMLIREEYRLAILVGLLGGFTTFSTFGYETVSLTDHGQFGLAGLNLLAGNGLGLAGAWLGARLAVAVYGS